MNIKYRLNDGCLTLINGEFKYTFKNIAGVSNAIITPKSRSLTYYEISAKRNDGTDVSYQMWEDLPIVRISDDSEKDLFEFSGEHWTVRAIKLNAFTDENDVLTEETIYELFFKGLHKVAEGEIFIFENVLSDKSYILISETPDHARAKMVLKRKTVADTFVISVDNGGYPVVIGECEKGSEEALCRDYFRHANHCDKLVTMSNTWGDCHSADRVCYDFIEKEIEAAKEIGVDIVQIDDGWQAGNTLYKCKRDERGDRIFDEPFWDLNTERFPNGIMPLSELAAKYGIKIGMWFAPSSHGCFAQLERDKAALRRCYEEYGARFFKLDMYQALDKAHVKKMQELLAEIYSFGDDVSVQMDVTRYERLNYLCGREYGTIFVENRYTKYATAYPHKALKNLWDISRYLPSNRFQFEMVNPDLNIESYAESDLLAPSLYSMDYLFATVMLSNPLFWMEIQFLSDERRNEMAKILSVWKEHRGALANADVEPIGERPSGVSLTGFKVSDSGTAKYLLLFRELSEADEFVLDVEGDAEILCSNTDVKTERKDNVLTVKLPKQRSYAFIKLN